MCGFVGFTNKIGDDGTVLKGMMDLIAHRGPDSQGFYTDENICMGFRRLSIIDLESGHQPMFNEDKSLALTFNGEIYNFGELREELTDLGHIFSNHSNCSIRFNAVSDQRSIIKQTFGKLSGCILHTLNTHTLEHKLFEREVL